MREVAEGVLHRIWTIAIVASNLGALMAAVALWPFLFPANHYIEASDANELDSNYGVFLPPDSTDILLRVYDSHWWITLECTWKRESAEEFANSIDAQLEESAAHSEITLPDHSTDASILEFLEFRDDSGRWLTACGKWGMGITILAYDTLEERFYFCKSKI